jgi:hypothetical protein
MKVDQSGVADPIGCRNNDEGPRAYVVCAEGTSIREDDVANFVEERVPPAKRLSGGVKFVSKLPVSEVSYISLLC